MACLLITAVTEFLCAISACSYLGYQIFKKHLINSFFSKGKVFQSLRLTDNCFKISHCGPKGNTRYVFLMGSLNCGCTRLQYRNGSSLCLVHRELY